MGDPRKRKHEDEDLGYDLEDDDPGYDLIDEPAPAAQAAAPQQAPDPEAEERGMLDTVLDAAHSAGRYVADSRLGRYMASEYNPSPEQLEQQRPALQQHIERLGTDKAYSAARGISSILPGGQVPVAGGASALGRIGASALSAGATRGMEAYGDDPDHDAIAALSEGRDAAAWGGGLGAAGEFANTVGQSALKYGRGLAGKALGAGQNVLTQMRKSGIDVPEDQVLEMADRAGVGPKWLGESTKDKLARVQQHGAQGGQQMGAAIDERDAQLAASGGAYDYAPDISRDTYMQADSIARGPGGTRDARAGAMSAEARATQDQTLDTLGGLREFKTNRDEDRYAHAFGPASDTYSSQAAGFSADQARGHLDTAMQGAGPKTYNQFKQGAQDFGEAQTLEAVLANRQTQLAGNPAGPFGDWTREQGLDMAANAWQRGGKALQGVGAAAPVAGVAGAAITRDSEGDKRAQTANASRGHLSIQAAETMLAQNPQELGKYAGELKDAQKRGTLRGTLLRLQQSDAEFRTNIYPKIQGLTAER